MATINQMYTLLNVAQKMAYGEVAVTVLDTSSFVSLGNFVMSSDNNRDNFFNVLYDRIGLVLNNTRPYETADDNIIRRDYEFGSMMQKIFIEPVEMEENPEWLIGNDDFVPEYAPVIKPIVRQKIFHNMVTYEGGLTIPDNMCKTAFVNEVGFAAFLVAMNNALSNGYELAKERAVDLTRATMIAYILNNDGANAINLVTAYNATVPQAEQVTAETFMRSEKAMAFACQLMAMTSERMARMNKVFNQDGYARHTPLDLLRVDVLNVFDYAVKYGVRPVVYNEKFIQLPNFKTVPYWQGAGVNYDFGSVSKINISRTVTDEATGEDEVETVAEQDGILAVMYDTEACGVNIFNDTSAFERNDRAHYTTHYRQMTAQYFYDSSEQAVVFYLD